MKIYKLLATLILSLICLIALPPILGLGWSVPPAQAAHLQPISRLVSCSSPTLPCRSPAVAIGRTSKAIQVGNTPALTLTKLASNLTPGAGELITFTILVRNNGDTNATQVQISDPSLPTTDTTYMRYKGPVTFTSSGSGNLDSLPNLVTIQTIAPDELVTVTFPITIRNHAGVGQGIVFPNTAAAEPTNSPDVAQDTINLTITNLVVSKQASSSNPQAGEVVTYTIIVTPLASPGSRFITIRDTLPPEVTFIDGSISTNRQVDLATYADITRTVIVQRQNGLAPGQTLEVTFLATVTENLTEDTIIMNTASVTSEVNITSTLASVSITATPPPPANLLLFKRVNNTRPAPGSPITYTIIVTNTGGQPATGAQITDILPEWIDFTGPITFSPPDAGNAGNINSLPVLADNLTIPASSTLILTLPAVVSSSLDVNTVITNTAQVTSNEVTSPASGSAVLIVPFPVLTLDKQVSNEIPQNGDVVDYTIVITNSGAATASVGSVTDDLPDGVDFKGPIDLDAPSGGTVNNNYPNNNPIVASGLTIPPDTAIIITIPVTVTGQPEDPAIVNTASATFNQPQLIFVQDSVVLDVVPPPVLEVVKEVTNSQPRPGETITFSITIFNNSDFFSLSSVTVTDEISPGLIPLAAAVMTPPHIGTTDFPPVVVSGLLLPPNDSVTISFPVLVGPLDEGTRLTNTATLTGSFFIIEVTETSNEVVLTIPRNDLALTKQVDTTNPPIGGAVNYTIIVTNTGDLDTNQVIISDTLPPGLNLDGQIQLNPPTSGTLTLSPTLAVTIPTLPPNNPVTVTIPLRVDSGVAPGTILTNTAVASSTEVPIPVTGVVSITVAPRPQNGLDITKQVSKSNPIAGEVVTYTISVVNIGQNVATTVRISDILPTGVFFRPPVVLTPNTITAPAFPSVITIPNLAVDGQVTATFAVTVNPNLAAGTVITNIAAVTSSKIIIPVTATATLTVLPSPVPNLTLAKQANTAVAEGGDRLTYTLVITNISTVNVNQVAISDTLPQQVTPTGTGRLDPGGISIPLTFPVLTSGLTIASGQKLTLTFSAIVNSGVPSGTLIINTASVTGAGLPDEATGQVSVRVTGPPTLPGVFLPIIRKFSQPDLVGSFTLNPPGPGFAAGQPVQITAVVTNVGTGPAEAFWVDFYINPNPLPGVNIPWDNTCTLNPCQGIAWYVEDGLDPGENIILRSTPVEYSQEQTVWNGSFVRGTRDLYLFVDSWNPTVPTGGVPERNEANNRSELHGLSVTGLTATGLDFRDPAELPARPAP